MQFINKQKYQIVISDIPHDPNDDIDLLKEMCE